MATYFFDIDGVIFKYGSNSPLEGSKAKLEHLKSQGHKIILTTARKAENNNPPHLCIENTKKSLITHSIPYDQIISDVDSPRIIINDEGAYCFSQWRNEPIENVCEFTDSDHYRKQKIVSSKVFNSLAAIAWTAVRYADSTNSIFDADEYFQTILIAKSIIKNNGVNHVDIVNQLRKKITLPTGHVLDPGGTGKAYKGQLSKLVASSDQEYLSKDGASDGAAMRTAAIAAFYCDDFKEMIIKNDLVARITHASIEARMSACLTTIRLRQAFHPYRIYSPNDLLREFLSAINILQLGSQASFFFEKCITASKIVESYADPAKQLSMLACNIGMDHLCWSTPVSAVFWTFHRNNSFKQWINHENECSLLIPIESVEGKKRVLKVDASAYGLRNREKDESHLKSINEFESFIGSHGYHYGKSMDIDTFFSIAFSVLSAINGIDEILPDLGRVMSVFGNNLFSISGALSSCDA